MACFSVASARELTPVSPTLKILTLQHYERTSYEITVRLDNCNYLDSVEDRSSIVEVGLVWSNLLPLLEFATLVTEPYAWRPDSDIDLQDGRPACAATRS